jgi:hypothetical protein
MISKTNHNLLLWDRLIIHKELKHWSSVKNLRQGCFLFGQDAFSNLSIKKITAAYKSPILEVDGKGLWHLEFIADRYVFQSEDTYSNFVTEFYSIK